MPIGWHRWFVRRHHDVLVFEAKPSPFLDERMGEYFRSQWGRDRSFMRWAWKHVDDLFLQHHWNGSLHVEVIELGGPACREIVEVDANDAAAEFDLVPGSRSKRNVYDLLARLPACPLARLPACDIDSASSRVRFSGSGVHCWMRRRDVPGVLFARES